MATRRDTGKMKLKSAAAVVKSNEDASDHPDTEEQITTFPTGDCNAGLPASKSFHEITYAEFKRLSVSIDDLPYPLIVGAFDLNRYYAYSGNIKFADRYRQVAFRSSLKHIGNSMANATGGGIPLAQYLNKQTGSANEPLFIDIHLADTYQFIQEPKARLRRSDKNLVTIPLSDDDKADLLASQPVIVKVDREGEAKYVRLLPNVEESSVPLRNEYLVGSVESFLRSPYLETVDGSRVRANMNAQQVKQLSESGKTVINVGRHKVTLRSQAKTKAAMNTMVAYKIKNGGLVTDNIDLEDEGTGGSTGSGSGGATPGTGTSGGSGSHAPPPPPPKNTTDDTGAGSTSTTNPSRLQLALYLPWRHRWVLKGYSRGELLHSLALGPQEETTIEISTWDRRKRTFEDSARSEFEQTSEFTETSKDTQTVAREISTQNEFGASVSADIGFKVEVVDVSTRTGVNAKSSVTDSSKNNLEILREAVSKTTNKLNLQRETKISETSETGTEQKVTRKIRNPNLCHTLTMNYYEVLAHYEIITELIPEDARLCIFDKNPLPLDAFNYKNIRYYESALRRVLLVPELANGFDAAHKLVAQESLCEAKARNEMCQATQAIAQTSTEDATAKALIDLAKRIVQTAKLLKSSTISSKYVPSPLMLILPWPIFTLDILDKSSLQRYMYLRRASSISPHLFDVITGLDEQTVSAADVQNLSEALGSISLATIGTAAISQDRDGIYNTLRDDLGVPSPPVVFTDIPEDTYAVNDAGLVAQINTFLRAVRDAAQTSQAAAATSAMDTNQAAIKSDYSNKEIAEALEAQEALTEHLNRYRNYYRTCILTLMPFPDAFQERLSMLPIVERRVLGFDNNEIALPVRPDSDPRAAALFENLVTDNKDLLATRTVQEVTLPTSGLHVETRLGECCACEDYIVDLRTRDIEMKDVEIALKKEELAQQKLETQRRSDRLDADMFEDPVQRPVEIRVEMPGNQAPKNDTPPVN